jgi:hypothetical protein
MGTITWIRADGHQQARAADVGPALGAIRDFVGGLPEHVTVLHDGRKASLYVHGMGAMLDLPINATASDIYRAAARARGADHALCIYGNAVLVEGLELIDNIRLGDVSATIWQQENGAYSTTVQRKPQGKDGSWNSVNAYSDEELMTLATVADMAVERIEELRIEQQQAQEEEHEHGLGQ